MIGEGIGHVAFAGVAAGFGRHFAVWTRCSRARRRKRRAENPRWLAPRGADGGRPGAPLRQRLIHGMAGGVV